MADVELFEAAAERAHVAIERAKLALWIGRLDDAKKEIDLLETTREYAYLMLAADAMDARREALKDGRQEALRLYGPSRDGEEGTRRRKRKEWEGPKVDARIRQVIAKTIAQKGVHERNESLILPTFAALRSLKSRLQKEEKELRIEQSILDRQAKLRKETPRPPEGEPEHEERIGPFRFLVLHLGEDRYEVRLLDAEHAENGFTPDDLARINPQREVDTLWLSKHEKVKATPTFRIFSNAGVAEFYFHSLGIGRATLALRDPASLPELVKIGLRTIGRM